MNFGMLIDLRKCVGCFACTIACKSQNGTPTGINFNKVKNMSLAPILRLS